MATRTSNSRNAGGTSLRHVWLAGLGLLSVLGRDVLDAGDRARGRVMRLQRIARALVASRK